MKNLNRYLVCFVVLISLVGIAQGQTKTANNGGQIIVNATEARVRNSASRNGKVLGSAKIGTVFSIISQKSNWYNINFNGNRNGWISVTIAEPFDIARRGSIYQKIAAKYFSREKLDFDTASELFDFLSGIQSEVSGTDFEPELAYFRVRALAAALASVTYDDLNGRSVFKEFLDKNEEEIAYSDPAGQYAVRTEIWWDLREKYQEFPIADEIAWQGAMTMIPGECEGYVVCHLFLIRETDGKYLEFYPSGTYAGQAFKNLADYLEGIAAGATGTRDQSGYYITPEPGDRIELEEHVSELREIVAQTVGPSKTKIIGFLDQIEAGYRPEPFDETGLDEFWEEIRSAVIKKDKNRVAELTQFPLLMPFGHNEIKTKAEFVRNYDRIMNLMADSASCFAKESLSREEGRYGVYCGFKPPNDTDDDKPNFYYFEKTESGWKLVGIDNVNE